MRPRDLVKWLLLLSDCVSWWCYGVAGSLTSSIVRNVAISASEHNTFTQCFYNAAPTSQTLAQHCHNIGSMCHFSGEFSDAAYLRMSRKHETLNQYWLNVGPASKALGQHWTRIWAMSAVFWECPSHHCLWTRYEPTSHMSNQLVGRWWPSAADGGPALARYWPAAGSACLVCIGQVHVFLIFIGSVTHDSVSDRQLHDPRATTNVVPGLEEM